MLKYILIIVLLPSTIFSSYGQKTMEKEWQGEELHKVELISDVISKVRIETWDSKLIKVVANIEGETFENVVLQTEESNGVLSLKPGYRPYFLKENDKLAAHKVLSVEVQILLPPGKDVHIKSALATVDLMGVYKEVYVGLEEGNCRLKAFQGNAILHTKNGDIIAEVIDSKGNGRSKYGKVINKLPEHGQYRIIAESVNGLITLLKSQE